MRIQDLPVHDRPREKLVARGVENLSDKELLAILIRTGRAGRSALDLGDEVLKKFPIERLLEITFEGLLEIKGLDKGKASTIVAAMELARRSLGSFDDSLPLISSPEDVLGQVYELRNYKKEHFVVLYLNARNQLLHKETVSVGTISASLVHPREVFEPAVRLLASSMVLAHNHPSGSLEPSDQDVLVTKRLREAGKLLDIGVQDHVIVGLRGMRSMRETGDW